MGTKAALRTRAIQHHRSVVAEVREILGAALRNEPVTMADLLAADDGAEFDFEPSRLALGARGVEL